MERQALPNSNVNVSNQAGTQSEAGIAVNPTNSQNLVMVANDLTDLSKMATWFSTDGGATWTANFIDETEDGLDAGDQRFDPNVAFDSDGNVYVVYSTTGTLNRVVVAKSTDGGATYSQATVVVTAGSGSANLHTSMITTRADGSGADDVLVVYAHVFGNERIEAALSLDGGATFPVTNTTVNDAEQRTFLPWAAPDAAGNFQVAWEVNQGGGTGVILHDTLDGTTLAAGTDNTITTVQITDFAAATSHIPPQPDRGVFSIATIDVDRTSGRVYLSYTDRANSGTNDTNIFVRFSDDAGANWGAAVQVNDDTTTTSQFLPRMAVDHTNGNIYAVWYDARNDATNNQRVNLFGSVSTNGGVTWSANQALSSADSDESTANPARDGNNYAEYLGLTANAGVAHPGWTDGRDANYTAGLNEEIFTTAFSATDLTNQPPVAICQNVVVPADDSCIGVVPAALVNNGSFDPDAGDPAPTCTLAPTGPFVIGVTNVTLTCVDPHGASAQCTATVTVVDNVPPSISCPVSVNVPCTNASGAVATFSTPASDTCSSVAVACTRASGSVFPLGTTVDTCTATDASGNQASCSFPVTVALGDNPTCCPAGTNVIVGTSNNDNLTGTNGADCILGRGGQDTINGNGGNDFISGGDGDDVLNGGAGNDVCFGGTGQDRISGNAGDDVLSGGDGDDQCFGGDGNDTLLGGQGQDRLFGENNSDTLFGETGDDRLEGGDGNDALIGGGLHDVCIGGPGVDTFLTCQTQTQ